MSRQPKGNSKPKQKAAPVSVGCVEVDRKDYAKINLLLGSKMEAKPRELEQAFRGGGSRGIREVKLFDREFKLLTDDILEVFYDGKVEQTLKQTVLQACAAILQLDGVPHWDDGHVEDIKNLRGNLEPKGYWEDYPVAEGDDDDELP